MLRLILLSIVQCLLLCGGQVMLKLAVQRMAKPALTAEFIVKSILPNWQLALCGAFFVSAGLLWMYILRHFQFSIAYPLTSLSFIFGMLAAMWIFSESVEWLQWVGVVFIVLGCFFVVK